MRLLELPNYACLPSKAGGLHFLLAFCEPIVYSRKTGLRTPHLSLHFRVLGDLERSQTTLADRVGQTSNRIPGILREWNDHLSLPELPDMEP